MIESFYCFMSVFGFDLKSWFDLVRLLIAVMSLGALDSRGSSTLRGHSWLQLPLYILIL